MGIFASGNAPAGAETPLALGTVNYLFNNPPVIAEPLRAVLFFWGNYRPPSPDGQTYPTMGLGMSFSVNGGSGTDKGISTASGNNQSTTQCSRASRNRAVTIKSPAASLIQAEGEVVDFNSVGGAQNFDIDWTNVSPDPRRFAYVGFFGAELEAQIVSFNPSGTQDAAATVTGVGFEPDAIFLISTRDAWQNTGNNMRFYAGFFVRDGSTGPLEQTCVGWTELNGGINVSQRAAIASGTRAMSFMTNDGTAIANTQEITDTNSDGFEITQRDGSGGGANEIAALCLKFNGAARATTQVKQAAIQGSPQFVRYELSGFQEQAVITLQTFLNGLDSAEQNPQSGSMGITASTQRSGVGGGNILPEATAGTVKRGFDTATSTSSTAHRKGAWLQNQNQVIKLDANVTAMGALGTTGGGHTWLYNTGALPDNAKQFPTFILSSPTEIISQGSTVNISDAAILILPTDDLVLTEGTEVTIAEKAELTVGVLIVVGETVTITDKLLPFIDDETFSESIAASSAISTSVQGGGRLVLQGSTSRPVLQGGSARVEAVEGTAASQVTQASVAPE